MSEMLKRRKYYILLSVLLAISVVFGISEYRKAKKLKYMTEIEYNRVFAELTEYVDDLEISLLKGQVVSSPEQMAKLSADLYGQASGAKANLALLPVGEKQLEKTSEFLSQVGEYANTISKKMLNGEALSEKEQKTMRELNAYASTLKNGFDKMLDGINTGVISFSNTGNMAGRFVKNQKTEMSEELEAMEKEFHNYPSLVYDGPFSHHLSLRESVMLKGRAEISKEQAKSRAAKFSGKGKSVTVSEINSKLPAYSVKGKNTIVEYTKHGGMLLMLIKDSATGEEKLSIEEAKVKAEMFLRDNGFTDMKESYYDKSDGSIIINYAYNQDEYIVFPDLVKVKVALDNGEIIGFESYGYVMNHIHRTIPVPKITKEQALTNVTSNTKIKDVSMALIPLDGGGEAYCYQIKGIVSDKHFLMYVNTQTGEIEDVQILIESDSGTLAV